MELIEQAYEVLLTGAAIVLAVLIIFSIIRSVLGPGIADRIIAVNMTGTMIIMVIAILSVFLDENYLVDVCLIYAMISFLGVVVLCKVYTGVYLSRKNLKADLGAIEDNLYRQGLDVQEAEPEVSEQKLQRGVEVQLAQMLREDQAAELREGQAEQMPQGGAGVGNGG